MKTEKTKHGLHLISIDSNDIINGVFSNDEITSVGDKCFSKHCETLTTVNLPLCNDIGNYCFYDCKKLTTVNIPLCDNIGDGCFFNCGLLSVLTVAGGFGYGNNWIWVNEHPEDCPVQGYFDDDE